MRSEEQQEAEAERNGKGERMQGVDDMQPKKWKSVVSTSRWDQPKGKGRQRVGRRGFSGGVLGGSRRTRRLEGWGWGLKGLCMR